MTQELSGTRDQEPKGFMARFGLLSDQANARRAEWRAQQAEANASQSLVRQLGVATNGAESALFGLCSHEAERLNPQFRDGIVPIDEMIDLAFAIARGMKPNEIDKLVSDEVRARRVLPLLDSRGIQYAVFDDNLAFHIAEGPAYLSTGRDLYVEIPAAPTQYNNGTRSAALSVVEVELPFIIERYKQLQAGLIGRAEKERAVRGGKRYESEQLPIKCARAGRVMGEQAFAQTDAEVQVLIQAAQEPLRQYFDDMIPRLTREGCFRADDSDTRDFLQAVDEARYLNSDKIQEVIDALVVEAAKPGSDTQNQKIDLLAVILARRNGAPKGETKLGLLARTASAKLEAITLVRAAIELE